jgi:hypothetical protein
MRELTGRPKPGAFPIGSMHSRAAARSLVTARDKAESEKEDPECNGVLRALSEAIRKGQIPDTGETPSAPETKEL